MKFKFEIGDIVITKTALEDTKLGLAKPRTMQIIERMFSECSGGIQIYYYVANEGAPIRIHENNLILSGASEVEKTIQIAKEIRFKEERTYWKDFWPPSKEIKDAE